MNERSAHDRRQRRLLIGLALMFFAPLAVAFYLYYGHGTWHPGGRVNAGELIDPPRPLPPLALPLLRSGSTDPNFLKANGRFSMSGPVPAPKPAKRTCMTRGKCALPWIAT